MKNIKMKETKKVVILIAVMIILLSQICPILAIPTLGVFKVNTCVELKQTCANCSFVNVTTIIFPDSSTATINDVMTKSGSGFNYTFCNNTMLGNYIVNGIGDPQGVLTIYAYDYSITTTGNNAPYTIPLFLGLAAFILLIMGFWIKNNYVVFIAGTLFVVLGLYLIIYGLSIISDMYTTALAWVTLGIGLLLLLASSYSAINDSNINLFGISRGNDDDD
jgi:hypothetical protein